MKDRGGNNRSPILFILVIFALTLPFYVSGNHPVLPKSFHIYAPAFVFASMLPALVAGLFLYRERGWDGVRELWKNILDYKRIREKRWLIPILLLMPATIAASYFLMPLIGKSIPDPHFPILTAPILFGIFFILAIGEEAGWSGYVIDALQNRWSALTSGIVLGSVWAAWHVVPYIQAHHSSNWWVVLQCFGTIMLRILMVWIYNNTTRSLFAMILFHAMINESEFMFPNLGSYYDPFFPFVILTTTVAVVVFLWGGKTLARYRFAATN
jgi:membrane protease YdiL (CAAX protease family)